MVIELKYGNTNTYLIREKDKYILFDTAWAGTFERFCKALGEMKIKAQDIDCLFISHFHPDHMGIAQQIASLGIKIVVLDIQKEYIHKSDCIFKKENKYSFYPIEDSEVITLKIEESRQFLSGIGIAGEALYTPGHTDDSISLCLDDGSVLVGDLNPLYEKGTFDKITQNSWDKILQHEPKVIYYGHAKTYVVSCINESASGKLKEDSKKYQLVSTIIKYIDRGYSIEKIHRKTGADLVFIEDVMRMYLTHQNVGVQGILDRIEIKNK